MADQVYIDTVLGWLEREGYIESSTWRAFMESPNSPQWRIRQGSPPKSFTECELATLEALVLQGGINAWNGDGVGCVAQMVWAQHQRAERAETELARLKKGTEL